MRVGRKPKKSALVESLDCSELAAARMRAMLDTLAGEITLDEGAERAGLQRARFCELRLRMMQAGAEALEQRAPGRPPKRVEVEPDRLERLEAENQYLREELDIARVRTELAPTMPHLLRDPVPSWGKASARSPKSSRRSSKQRSGTTRGSAS